MCPRPIRVYKMDRAKFLFKLSYELMLCLSPIITLKLKKVKENIYFLYLIVLKKIEKNKYN